MDLYKKVYPDSFDDIIFYKDQLDTAVKWITDFKNNVDRSKKVLLIIGDTGSGKTSLAQLLLKKFEYQIIELNSGDIRSQKKIGEFLHKTLGFNNVLDMFYEKKRPIGLILDELETLCQNTDKGGLSEFIQILKDNAKYEKNKKKVELELKKNPKSKSKKTEKVKIDMNKFIFIENPIICTYTDNNDKKINELKNFSCVLDLKDIKFDVYKKFFNHIKNIINVKTFDLKNNILKEITLDCENDIRKFIQCIENVYMYQKNNKNININELKNLNGLKNLGDTTKNDIQLIDAVNLFFREKLSISKLDLLFYLEPYHLPYTVYQNLNNFLNNTTLNTVNKFEVYSFFLNSLSNFDKTNNLIYDCSEWADIDDSLKLFGLYHPNSFLHSYKFKIKKETPIEFTNIHNKASQMLVNKKLISNAKYSLNKKYTTINNTILDCEVLFEYFNEFRELIMNEDFKNLNKKNLIKFMNHYKISYNDLENILKIEKINKDEDKRKKNITVLLKEKIIENLDITLQN